MIIIMDNIIQTIPLFNLTIAFIPVLIGLVIILKWSLDTLNAVYAVVRMLIQLLLIGHFLAFIFGADNSIIVITVLAVMLFSSSWIALRTIADKRRLLYRYALQSIAIGGGMTLLLITQGVLSLKPWYLPQFMVPLAGMIFANSMNSVSLAAERFNAEVKRGVSYEEARNTAIQTSLIPIINSLFAVGLVSLPGMMTGQILSGVSPLIAVRYQIMVMTMIFGSSVVSTAIFLTMIKTVYEKEK